MTIENEISKVWRIPPDNEQRLRSLNFILPSIVFDESDKFVCFGSMVGIKVLNFGKKKI